MGRSTFSIVERRQKELLFHPSLHDFTVSFSNSSLRIPSDRTKQFVPFNVPLQRQVRITLERFPYVKLDPRYHISFFRHLTTEYFRGRRFFWEKFNFPQ